MPNECSPVLAMAVTANWWAIRRTGTIRIMSIMHGPDGVVQHRAKFSVLPNRVGGGRPCKNAAIFSLARRCNGFAPFSQAANAPASTLSNTKTGSDLVPQL
jgi:hypothetical protein